MLDVGEVSENHNFLETLVIHFGGHFGTLELILGALGTQRDPFWYPDAPGDENRCFLGFLRALPGSRSEAPFGHQKRKNSTKNIKKLMPEGGLENQ